MSCTFCLSKDIRVKRITQFGPQIELKDDGEYGPVEDFCCEAQRRNHRYVAKAYHPDHKPNMEDVEKW